MFHVEVLGLVLKESSTSRVELAAIRDSMTKRNADVENLFSNKPLVFRPQLAVHEQ